MKRLCQKRAALISLLILALLIAAPIVATWRVVRQERLNRALIASVKRNDDQGVVTLLNQGADANCRDEPPRKFSLWETVMQVMRGRKSQPSHGPTPLLLALEPQPPDFDAPPENLRLVRTLLDHGARVNQTYRHVTPLLYAVLGGKNATIRLLLAHGAKPQGTGLLWRSVIFDVDVGVIADLLDRGMDVNQKDFQGTTALNYAVSLNRIDVVRLLLARHADPTLPNDYGQTPLSCVLQDTSPQGRLVARLLKAAGTKK